MKVSVIIPVRNCAQHVASCLSAVDKQTLDRSDYEIIVVLDESPDGTESIVRRFDVRLIQNSSQVGAPRARQIGLSHARGEWVAFIDCDCIPSHRWLESLLQIATKRGAAPVVGVAGLIVGYQSDTPAARFVDLVGGMNAERLLSHPKFPFPPTANVMYRRDALEQIGGFDERFFHAYDGCDLYTRLRAVYDEPVIFEPRALVLHQHRKSWKAYWKQQVGYGRGLGAFALCYAKQVRWNMWRELNTWLSLIWFGLRAVWPGKGDPALIRRGLLIRQLAHRIGFVSIYWNRRERSQW